MKHRVNTSYRVDGSGKKQGRPEGDIGFHFTLSSDNITESDALAKVYEALRPYVSDASFSRQAPYDSEGHPELAILEISTELGPTYFDPNSRVAELLARL